MKIGLCSDHAGLEYKNKTISYLLSKGYEVANYGTDSPESCDYPDFAHALANAVESGEVDAGIVYGTDAKKQAGKVAVSMVLEGHEPVLYPIAVATTGKNAKMGQAFVDFVLSPEGQAVLAKHGFAKP